MKRCSRCWFVAALLTLVLGPVAVRADTILHDFESGTEEWENESAAPVHPHLTTNMVHHGLSALAFDFQFGKRNPTLHIRCKEDGKDYSKYPGFRGFSAWVYVSLGTAAAKVANFEVQMFVRSGENWQWTTGDLNSEIGLGWVKVDIRRDQIFDLTKIQDIGIQVRNGLNDVKASVYIDQVEAVGVDLATEPPSSP